MLEGPLAKWRSLDEKGVIARAGIEAMFRRYSSDRTKIQANVAVGDASGIALPLARDCLAVIGPRPKDEELLPSNVEVLNRLQVQEARQYVYYHPDGRLKAFVQAASRPAA